ncbi:hypothetical protein ABE504_26205 [Paenibacillus oryzisoli]|uniref:hypothetical protein n=1 Tax=Paenibacillus oryzisoli TaxID=1850517 RepID=UPI003D2C0E5B
MSTCVVTFVYPQATKYFRQFRECLEKQGDPDFDLVIFNDGCIEKDLELLVGKQLRTKIYQNSGKSIAHIRVSGLRILVSDIYENIIFADIDDICSSNRVEYVKRYLNLYPIVMNDLILINEDSTVIKASLISETFANRQRISHSAIKSYNMIGMSNSAIKRNMVNIKFLESILEDTIAFDWSFYTEMLHRTNAVFINEAKTYYRQHGQNTALFSDFRKEEIFKNIAVKIQHYRNVCHLSTYYRQEVEYLSQLNEYLNDDSHFNSFYKKFQLNKGQSFPWWSVIPESEVWKNEIQF